MLLKSVGFRIPEDLLDSLDRIADEIGANRTELVVRILTEKVKEINSGLTVVQRETALSRAEIEDAFQRLAAPLITRIEALEGKNPTTLLQAALKLPSQNGAPIKRLIEEYLKEENKGETNGI